MNEMSGQGPQPSSDPEVIPPDEYCRYPEVDRSTRSNQANAATMPTSSGQRYCPPRPIRAQKPILDCPKKPTLGRPHWCVVVFLCLLSAAIPTSIVGGILWSHLSRFSESIKISDGDVGCGNGARYSIHPAIFEVGSAR
jgi:hypothetical protein